MSSTKREQIITTARALFAQHGPKRITIEEICREAGVSKMTFYRHFSNKKQLAGVIADRIAEETFAAFDAIDALDLPFPDKIDRMTAFKAQQARSTRLDWLQAMVDTTSIQREFEQRFLANLKRAQARGEIRADLTLEFHLLLVRKVSELFHEGDWQQVLPDAESFTRHIRTILWYGLLTRDEESS
jgi:AcrR family transcriptional regulator